MFKILGSLYVLFMSNWYMLFYMYVHGYFNLIIAQLLDSFTIATVMALSFVFLRVRYKVINLMGVCLSLIGIVTLVLADIQGSRVERGEGGRERE